ncbi:NUDIX domain-containing protein [Pararhizobium haloflavum]|uniref:NUDIX domain-containing protein n=1 Tax=Pararhizobium haloflavum TaxID=2037914 RepID=UPI001FE1F5A3|nr:NUDIX domain-containing protein [Pararhizobium haloflavum]
MVKVLHPFFLLKRPMILGVRAAAFDGQGRVFLVRHTYVSGWHLPGGGVERGESAGQALEKELREEGNLRVNGPPQLFAAYLNRAASRWDHVLLYHCSSVTQDAPKHADREIAEADFFPTDRLPDGTTAATRRRLEELNGSTPSPYW